MPLEDVKLIENDQSAQRLVAAWPHLSEHEESIAMLREWASISQVPLSDVYRLKGTLLKTGICRRDGTIDEAARAFLAAGPATTIKKASTQKKTTPGRGGLPH